MSLKDIARDLYHAQQAVEALEKELAAAPVEEEVLVKARLAEARAELQQLRNILAGRKKSATLKRKFV